jgi:hypothetical protein
MTLPNLPQVDPGTDPDRFVRELLGRYFAPGWLDRIIRTWVPIGIGSVLAWLNANYSVLGLPEKPSATAVITISGLIIAAYYALASIIEKRWPRFGRWLIALNLVRTQPVYVEPPAQQAVQSVADGAALRRSMS